VVIGKNVKIKRRIEMGFTLEFRSFGHAIAKVAKYVAVGVGDVVKVASKSQAIAPEVEVLVGALAGPAAAQFTDLAFHALGDIAMAIERVGKDATTEQTAQGLNVMLDIQTVNDIKAAIPQLKRIITALGGEVPKL
jgi:hypothetical protein